MYFCEKHGRIGSEWCDDCGKIISCDCRDQTSTRFKDLIYDCEDGERTATIWVHHCQTCGKPYKVELQR